MGKTVTNAERVRKPKTAAQLAKKAANIAAWEKRNAELRAGTFKSGFILAADRARMEDEARRAEKARREAETPEEAIAFLDYHLYEGPLEMAYLNRLRHFIGKHRQGVSPVDLAQIVRNWLATQGYPADIDQSLVEARETAYYDNLVAVEETQAEEPQGEEEPEDDQPPVASDRPLTLVEQRQALRHG